MSTLVILQQMAVIAILVLIGVYLQKKDIVDDLTEKKLSVIIIDIVNPALILSCVLSGNMTVSHKELLQAVGVGFVIYIGLCILGFLIPKVLPVPKDEKKYYNMMCVYTNVGFIGIPLAKAVLTSNAMIYVVVFNVLYSLFFYTHGMQVLGGENSHMSLKKMLNPGTIMSILTLVIFWFDISLPAVLANSIIYLGNATVFLSMSLLGVSIAKLPVKEGLKEKGIWGFVLLRMLVVPTILVLILNALHFNKEMVEAFFLMTALPAGNLSLIQAEKSGQDTAVLSKGIMVTTILCFATITVLMSILF